MASPTLALPPWIWVAFISSVCTAALLKGSWSERVGALTVFGGWIATIAVEHHRWHEIQWGTFVVDGIVLAILVWLSLRSDRFWPIWAAGFQLLAVVTHAARVVDTNVSPWAYITAALIWGYMLVGALAFGTWSTWRRRQLTEIESGAPSAEPGATLR